MPRNREIALKPEDARIDEDSDAVRFALARGPGPARRGIAACLTVVRNPAAIMALLRAGLSGKRLRVRQSVAALFGLDHARLWLSRRSGLPGRPARPIGPGADRPPADATGGGPTDGGLVILLTGPGHTPAAGAREAASAAFDADPTLQALYGDALLQAEGDAVMPLLRPAFDPDYLAAVDYVGPVIAVRRSALAAIGGPGDAPPAARATDLLLRVAARFGAGSIGHLPQVLSVWRIRPDGGAGEERPSHRAARLRAVGEHLARTGEAGAVAAADPDGVVTIRRPLPDPRPLVSLVVPTRDRLDLLVPCIDGLLHRTDWPAREILICDNDSRAPATSAYLRDLEARGAARVVACPGPFNFAAMNNAAAIAARGRLLAFVNNDVEVIAADWLARMAAEALRPDVGAVGAKLLDGEGRIQHAGIVLGTGGLVTHAHRFFAGEALGYLSGLRATRAVSAVTAACLVVEASKFARVGGFDAQAFAVDFNDVDLCLRLGAAGYRTLLVAGAVLRHREAASRAWTPEARDRHAREVDALRRRWGPLLAQDPHYHPGFDPDLGTYARLRPNWPGGVAAAPRRGAVTAPGAGRPSAPSRSRT